MSNSAKVLLDSHLGFIKSLCLEEENGDKIEEQVKKIIGIFNRPECLEYIESRKTSLQELQLNNQNLLKTIEGLKQESQKQLEDKNKEIEQLKQENISNKPKQHKMTIHLRHYQDWSYGIEFDFYNNLIKRSTGHNSPKIRPDQLFPKDKIPKVFKIDIAKVENRLDGKICGPQRSLTIDKNTGILWTETPYGHRYGRNVTWDIIIDLVIHYH